MDSKTNPAIIVDLSRDAMTAFAEIVNFSKVHKLTPADVFAELESMGILTDLADEQAIKELLATGTRQIIASGRPVENGTDAEFSETFFFEDTNCPTIDLGDVAHYYRTKRYITVEEGEVVMIRQPATEGSDGITLLGKAIKAKKGKSKNFKKYPGTRVSDTNENHLIAEVHGHPILQTQGVKVDQTLTLKEASLKSGNVNYDGSVVINGDVLPQVAIVASGDIFIKGTVDNAYIEAGNNIVIGGGVLSESTPNKNQPPKITTTVKAGGEVHAKFLNSTDLRAGGNIKVQSYIMNSEVVTEQTLQIGEGSGKGALIGGKTLAAAAVTANEIGSVAYPATKVVCGDAITARQSLSETSKLLHRRHSERQQLEDILVRIKDDPAPQIGEVTINRRVRITNAINNLDKVLKQIKINQSELQLEVAEAEAAFVQINKKLFSNVYITINGQHYLSSDERGKTRITCPDGKIQIQ